MLHRLFPECARAVTAGAQDEPAPLFPEEALSVRTAVPVRQREFALGRWCARRALAALGVAPQAIRSGPHRAPVWPAGIVGSITHCDGFAGAVVAPAVCLRSVGVDAEIANALPPDLVPLVCTASELSWIRDHPEPEGPDWAKVIFSAKEAVYKCISPLGAASLDFLDVTLALHPELGTFSARPATPAATQVTELGAICGRLAFTGAFVLTSAFVKTGAPR